MLTINELFSGIGAQVAALRRLGVPYNVVGISEIDKPAIQSYEAINGQTRNYGDISKAAMLDYADLWTYSFPCQDLSVAGKQLGIKQGTRSGLLFEVERLLETAVMFGNQPKYLLLENVKALVGKKFKPDFDRWLNKLTELGYNNYWQVLNAKDYGIPQNRERVFVVSIRKDLNQPYMFPEPVPLTLKLKDLLESEVDEKYYLSQEKVEKLCLNLDKEVSNTGSLDSKHTWDVVIAASRGRNPSSREAGLPTEQRLEVNSSGCSNTLTTVQKDNYVVEAQVLTPKRTEYGKAIRKEYEAGNIKESRHNMTDMLPRTDGVSNTLTTVQKDNLCVEYLGNCLYPDKNYTGHNYAGATFDADGLAPTLNTMNGGNREPYVTIKTNTKEGYDIAEIGDSINFAVPTLTTRRGRIGKEVAQTLMTSCEQGVVVPINTCADGTANALTAHLHKETANDCVKLERHSPATGVLEYSDGIRIRKLTPKECWRLMGFTDVEFDVAQLSGVSNSQLYKQAGNSIVVDVLAAIFKELL